MIQDNLKWNTHIKGIINKLNCQIPLYLTLKNILPPNKLNMIYKSISMSVINYGIELYGKNNNKWMIQLQKTQNRLLKIFLKKQNFIRRIHYTKKVKFSKSKTILELDMP